MVANKLYGRIVANAGRAPGWSGVSLLRHGKDAFAARALLARTAQRTLDVQYYIWHDDLSGFLMLDELVDAADRGIKVRLLLDDNGIPRLDDRLAAVAAHENIEIRLYNPFRIRWPKPVNWLFAFERLNHRMHSKSFTVDGIATIIGGRNIGDEYFAAKKEGIWVDLEVMATGGIVAAVETAFERGWTSPRTSRLMDVIRPVSKRRRRALIAETAARAHSVKAQNYLDEVRSAPLFREIAEDKFSFREAELRLVHHDPDNEGPKDAERTGLAQILPRGLGTINRELDIISGYFVPTEDGVRDLAKLAQNGVTVRVLTNCYASTDVGFVHAGYAPYRPALLEAGVQLFEMPAPDDKPRTTRKFVRPGSRLARAAREPGTTLHAKAFVVDRTRLYIGSANFDPRSAHLNTELGFVIESPELADLMAGLFDREIASNSYRLVLAADGRVQWIDERDDEPSPERTEPGTTAFSRSIIALIARLPFERLL